MDSMSLASVRSTRCNSFGVVVRVIFPSRNGSLFAMKKRLAPSNKRPTAKARPPELAEALLGLKSVQEVQAFLVDLCTPAELEALADRWRVVPLLLQAMPYRKIHDRTGISVTTVGRVARCLMQGEGGYRAAARHLGLSDD